MRAGDHHRPRRSDELGCEIGGTERHVGAVLAKEDERKCLAIANAQDHQRRQSLPVGDEMARVDALAPQLLADETAHGFIADPRQQRRSQAEPCRADGDIGRTAADIFVEARHVLEAPADLAAIEIDGYPSDGDEVEPALHHDLRRSLASSNRHLARSSSDAPP